MPPYGAQVSISGEGAAALIDSFGTVDGVQARTARWSLVARAESHNPILDRLAEIERPAAHVRIDVDPLRV